MHPHSLYFSSRLTITSQRSNRDDEPVNVVHKEIAAGVAVVRFNVLKISVECLTIGSLDQGTRTSARQFMKCSHLRPEVAWCREMSSD
jgi:hypothetical protein